jgi:hypothetical protein
MVNLRVDKNKHAFIVLSESERFLVSHEHISKYSFSFEPTDCDHNFVSMKAIIIKFLLLFIQQTLTKKKKLYSLRLKRLH